MKRPPDGNTVRAEPYRIDCGPIKTVELNHFTTLRNFDFKKIVKSFFEKYSLFLFSYSKFEPDQFKLRLKTRIKVLEMLGI